MADSFTRFPMRVVAIKPPFTPPLTVLKHSRPIKDFQPRSYQTAVFEAAMRQNTIAVLETGSGKTFIAVMVMREIGHNLRTEGKKPLMVFLAPTVQLVNQQFEVIRDYTDFDVAEYFGDKGVDGWSGECWEKEIYAHEVLVMTPQILLDALRHAFLSLNKVCLIVFDECHRATGNHPYANIMQEFYSRSREKPAIFGMTASPVIRKGVSSDKDSEAQISTLESIMGSKVFMVEDRAELQIFAPSAKEVTKYYDAPKFHFEDLKSQLEALFAKIDASLVNLQESPSNQFQDTCDIVKETRTSISKCSRKILYCLDTLGVICAWEATMLCIEDVHALNLVADCNISRETSLLYTSFLDDSLRMIEETLPQGHEELVKTISGYLEGTHRGYISPKLDTLVQILQSFRLSEEELCLIFVERIIAVQVIERFIKKLSNLSYLSTSYLTGGNSSKGALTPKMQRTTMDMFRSGKVNILLSTDVAEEGIHVPNCSWVIRFDLPSTVRSYLQSRGRARSHNSNYVLMLERANIEQRNRLFDIIRSNYLTHNALCKNSTDFISEAYDVGKMHAYIVESTGAAITPNSSVNLIYKYCEKLPKDRYFNPRPYFDVTIEDGLYKCMVTLPSNAAFQRIVGPRSMNSNLAKQLVCLEACKKLHELGALNENLLPYLEQNSWTDVTGIDKEYASGAGSTKRKELHGMVSVRTFSGTWVHKQDTITLNAYKFNFVCNLESENFSGFVLLIEAELDDDVAHGDFELHLVPNKVVKTSVSPHGKVQLNANQVERSKLFQEFFFNGIFGKLFRGTKSTGNREFLFREGNKIEWSSSNVYLLLPINSSLNNSNDTLEIHWKAVDACASVVEFLRSMYSLDAFRSLPDCCADLDEANCQSSEILHLANKPVHVEHLKDSVVLSIHTGRMYSVLDVTSDITSESPLDELCEEKPSKYVSFTEYYLRKYNIALQHPEQPMLLLKQSHNPHNLFSEAKFEDGFGGQNTVVEKKQVHVRVPPELLVHINISTDILKSFYLLPSMMHRLESLMLASQLRDEIGCSPGNSRISSFLVLEAITTLRCCENFSLERLELLGDAVLKYALSCHLFLKYPKNHEGQLTDNRTWVICNSTLHRLGICRSLQGYIRDNAFDPRRWVAPGQISLRPFPCKCGVNTSEVPLERAYTTEDTSVVVGKPCDRGHRWMCSKTIADCVEALIGAYYVGGGLSAALSLMRWLGADATFDTLLVEEAKKTATLWNFLPKTKEIEMLESKLSYRFSVKGLLLEAITHPSQQELGIGYCYQRLEFLGDAVLDLLLTRYLFRKHSDIDPGELTDLRSASVSNENFAQAAVRNKLVRHLQHGSGVLLEQITEYVKCLSEYQANDGLILTLPLPKGPKVLGDMVESIAGAILIDTNLNLDKVWEVFEPLLSPIITPGTFALSPLRELLELCSWHGIFIETKYVGSGSEETDVELTVQLKDELLVGRGCERSKKAAKAQAALCLLKELKERGISHAQYVSRRNKCDIISTGESCHSTSEPESCLSDSEGNIFTTPTNTEIIEHNSSEKQNMAECSLPPDSCNHSGKSKSKIEKPVVRLLKNQKGGPRSGLFDLCKILQWPMPKYESEEQQSRTPIVRGGVVTPYFNSFTSKITLHIPNTAVITLVGEAQTDKKRAHDSASLAMLVELEKQERCTILES